jgi:hypothetical protein
MYTLLKSVVGPFPEPHYPGGIDLKSEDRKARRRLYPVTVLYLVQVFVLLGLAFRSGHVLAALGFLALGLVAWIPIEYLVHRHILHGAFPNQGGPIARGLHVLFDASHADHHARPWDGMYINGHVDTVFAAVVLVPLSFLAPFYTAPVFVATITVLIATGLRRSELLALRWADFDVESGVLAVTGKVVRKRGAGLVRIDETKTTAGRRTIPLPSFAVTALTERRKRPFIGEQEVIFASKAGTLRDPENFAGQWRGSRAELGVPDATSHSFRKS